MRSLVASLFRLLRTVRYLKLGQLTNRVSRRLKRPTLSRVSRTALIKRQGFERLDFLETNVSILGGNRFSFLNKEEILHFPEDWDNKVHPILWRYNLHYFNGLLAVGPSLTDKQHLVLRWIEENPVSCGVGWDPYPLSLRIVNLIKWSIASNVEHDVIYASICTQTRVLMKTLEYHLLGNHLIENAKALVFAGVFFEGEEAQLWLGKGLAILDEQLPEQTLGDGAHFELSTMYQGVMLECVLDILQLAKQKNSPPVLKEQVSFYTGYVTRMASWLAAMIHPDNKIAFFNDATHGISHPPKILFRKAQQLSGWEKPRFSELHSMVESGYYRVNLEALFLIFDAAEVGARYLAGHGHADTLSLEMSLFGERVFVNVGTSEYGAGERRAYERSTAAHNTLVLEGKDSSEVWGGFRVGRRAKVQSLKVLQGESTVGLRATHTGYQYLHRSALHSREIDATTQSILIHDSVGYGHGVVRFHLHPNVQYKRTEGKNEGEIVLNNGVVITWNASAADVYTESYMYACEFGVLQESVVLCLVCSEAKACELSVNWS